MFEGLLPQWSSNHQQWCLSPYAPHYKVNVLCSPIRFRVKWCRWSLGQKPWIKNEGCCILGYELGESSYVFVYQALFTYSVNFEEDQSFNRDLRYLWVWSVSNSVFLASAYESEWSVLSPAMSSSHRPCTVGVLIMAEFARDTDGAEILGKFLSQWGFWSTSQRRMDRFLIDPWSRVPIARLVCI